MFDLWPQGRQEDAEEFLGCVLDGLHEEMVLAKKMTSESKEADEGQCNKSVYSYKLWYSKSANCCCIAVYVS